MTAANPRTGRSAVAGVATAAVAVGLTWVLPDFRLYQLALTGTLAVAMVGLTVLTGCSGQVSFGHGALAGIGAYAAAILVDQLGLSYALAAVAAAAICFGTGFGLGVPAVRLPVNGLALVTLAGALALPQAIKKFDGLTGGAYGIFLTTDQKLNSPWSGLTNDQFRYLVVVLTAAPLCWIGWNVVRGRWGLAMMAVRDQPVAAAAMGVDLPRTKVAALALSAGYAGVAGALQFMVVGHVSPDQWSLALSLSLVTGIVIGGLGSIAGAVIGAAFLTYVTRYAPGITPAAPGLAIGAATVLVVVLAPGGLVSVVPALTRRLSRHRPR